MNIGEKDKSLFSRDSQRLLLLRAWFREDQKNKGAYKNTRKPTFIQIKPYGGISGKVQNGKSASITMEKLV